MQAEGPVLETLTRRLAETPEDFLAEPRIGNSGRVHVAAVVGDLVRTFGAPLEAESLGAFEGTDIRRDRNRLAVGLLLAWLLADDWFRQNKLPAGALLEPRAAEERARAIREALVRKAAEESADKFTRE